MQGWPRRPPSESQCAGTRVVNSLLSNTLVRIASDRTFETLATAAETGRQKASPRPGLKLARRWPMDEAERLDRSERLVAEVAKALNVAVAALGP
jgi:hypothetical protein